MRRSLFPAAIVLLAAAACGGGGASTSGTTTATPAASAAATTAGTTAPATASPAATAKAPSFLDLVGAAKTASYKVTYKWTGTGQGQAIAAEQTWYVMGASSRFDFSGPEGSISLFDLKDGAYMCITAPGQPATCLGPTPKDAALQGNQGAAFSLQVEDKPDQFDPTFEGVRTIAGQSAQCFGLKEKVVSATPGLDSGRICYAANGVPLLMESKGAGFDMTFEATAFSTNVTDADFRLPAPPVKFGQP
ncbi:MAG TPA: hypothetical protein VFW12_08635 [Candidatus Limnocylindria bacterium]|nr:hypothetical protein [Candidatus Limnocylindria bacterium]